VTVAAIQRAGLNMECSAKAALAAGNDMPGRGVQADVTV
jgi:hypothetical protein